MTRLFWFFWIFINRPHWINKFVFGVEVISNSSQRWRTDGPKTAHWKQRVKLTRNTIGPFGFTFCYHLRQVDILKGIYLRLFKSYVCMCTCRRWNFKEAACNLKYHYVLWETGNKIFKLQKKIWYQMSLWESDCHCKNPSSCRFELQPFVNTRTNG